MTDSTMEEATGLLLRLKGLQERGPTDSWVMEALVWRNDVEEFMGRFQPGSKDQQELHAALNPMLVGDEGDWFDFWKDYGTPVGKALTLVAYRIKKGQAQVARVANDEILVDAGAPHSAYVVLRDLVEKAASRLWVVDPWVDRTLFDLLSNVPATVELRILTRKQNTPGDFVTEATKFKAQHGSKLEVRDATDIHDRFLVVDNRVFFSGASFKDLGKRKSVVAEIFDLKAETEASLAASWQGGAILL